MTLEEMAGIIDAEASVLYFQGKLGVAQCIIDNRYNANAFTEPVEDPSEEALMVAELAVKANARRFTNAKIQQFRSFTRYDTWEKIYGSIPHDLLYLGEDRTGEFGHRYFGRYTSLRPFKLLLIAGHGRNVNGSWDPGAIGCGYEEANLTRELTKIIKHCCDLNGLDCDIAPDRNYYSYLKNGGTFDFIKYNYILEVHFNAMPAPAPLSDDQMKGSMFFIDKSERGQSVEEAILNKLYSIGSKKAWDGVVLAQRNYGPGGLLVQSRARAQGVSHGLLETCFINDIDDVLWYQKNKTLIGSKIVEGIIEGFGLNKSDNPFAYVGKGIATAEANEDMAVRDSDSLEGKIIGIVLKNQKVEVLEKLDNGWLKIVWPGYHKGYGFTSNVKEYYYNYI